MRIFCAVRHASDPHYYYGALWSSNFYPALRELGHEVIESQTDLLAASRFMHIAGDFTPEELALRAEITGQIINQVRVAHREKAIDLFLSYFYNAHFDPAGFDQLRSLGIPSVNFYCNSIYQFPLVAEIATKADYSWHPEKDARGLYLSVGAQPVWVQMAADPDVYRPRPEVRRKPSACFVGQRYADRDRWMATLIRAKFPVEIYGPGWGEEGGSCGGSGPGRFIGVSWPHAISRGHERQLRRRNPGGRPAEWIGWRRRAGGQTSAISQGIGASFPLFRPYAKGSIPFQRIADVFAEHEVCLNFSNVWADGRPGSKLIPHVRLRDFEAPMCKACYLTGHSEEIADFYEVGREIDTYRTREELVDKARFYLGNPDAAEKLRTAGYERARRDHTWKRRFEQLFSKID